MSVCFFFFHKKKGALDTRAECTFGLSYETYIFDAASTSVFMETLISELADALAVSENMVFLFLIYISINVISNAGTIYQ